MSYYDQKYDDRPDLSRITYRLFGWWFMDGLLIVFWIVPLVLALGLGLFAVGSALILHYAKDRWSGKVSDDWLILPKKWVQK